MNCDFRSFTTSIAKLPLPTLPISLPLAREPETELQQLLKDFFKNPARSLVEGLTQSPQRIIGYFERAFTIDSKEKAERIFANAGNLSSTSDTETVLLLATIRFPQVAKQYLDSIPPELAKDPKIAHYMKFLRAHAEAAPALTLMSNDKLKGGRTELTDVERKQVQEVLEKASPDARLLIAERIIAVAPQEAGLLTAIAKTITPPSRAKEILCAVALYAPDSLATLEKEKTNIAPELQEIRDASKALTRIDPRLNPTFKLKDEKDLKEVFEKLQTADISKLNDNVAQRMVRILQKQFPEGAAELAFRNFSKFNNRTGLGILAELSEQRPREVLLHLDTLSERPEYIAKILIAESIVHLSLQDPAEAAKSLEKARKGPLGKDKLLIERVESTLDLFKALQKCDMDITLSTEARRKTFLKEVSHLKEEHRTDLLLFLANKSPDLLFRSPELLGTKALFAMAERQAFENPGLAIKHYPTHKNEALLKAASFSLGASSVDMPELPKSALPGPLNPIALPKELPQELRKEFDDGRKIGRDLVILRGSPTQETIGSTSLIGDKAIRNLLSLNTGDLVFPSPHGTFVPLSELPQTESARWTKENLLDLKLSISRNLLSMGLGNDAESVKQACVDLFNLRAKLGAVPITSGRDIYILANDQNWSEHMQAKNIPRWLGFWAEETHGDPKAFANQQLQKKITDSGARSLTVFRPDPTEITPIVAKDKFLMAFSTAKEESTFALLGHGLPDAFAITGGSVLNGTPTRGEAELTAGEFADALLKRAEARRDKKSDAQKKDIVLVDACFSQDYIREVVERIQARCQDKDTLAQLPVFLVASERGQLSFSTAESEKIDFSSILFRDKTKPATLKDVWDLKLPASNPGIFLLQPKDKEKNDRFELFQLGQRLTPENLSSPRT